MRTAITAKSVEPKRLENMTARRWPLTPYTRGAWFSAAMLLLLVAFPGVFSGVGRARDICIDKAGRRPVIEAGREQDVLTLLRPNAPGEHIRGALEGWTLGDISIQFDEIAVDVLGPDPSDRLLIRIRFSECPNAVRRKGSFSFNYPQRSRKSDAGRAIFAIIQAVEQHDDGTFWRTWLKPPPIEAGTTPESAQLPEWFWPTILAALPSAPPKPPELPPEAEPEVPSIHHSVAGSVVLLLLSILMVLINVPQLAGDLHLTDRAGAQCAVAVLGITALGAFLRFAAGPVVVEPAFPLPEIGWLTGQADLDMPLPDGAPGARALMATLGPFMDADPFAAWFHVNLVMGIVTVPWAFAAATAITGRRTVGLVSAGLLALWPQHIVLSYSEAAEVPLVLWGLAAFTLTTLAAKTGRTTTFLAAATTTAFALTVRPESYLLAIPLVLLALTAGSGFRQNILSPLRWITVIALGVFVVPVILAMTRSGDAGAWGDLTGEALVSAPLALVSPMGQNALFDVQNTAVWLYPLAIVGVISGWKAGWRGPVASLAIVAASAIVLTGGRTPRTFGWDQIQGQALALMAGAPLAALGLTAAVDWFSTRRKWSDRVRAISVVAFTGLSAVWWPSVAAFPLDWQRDIAWARELAHRHPEQLRTPGTKLVVRDGDPNNSRLAPRFLVPALTGGVQGSDTALGITEAAATLGSSDSVLYYEGLACYSDVPPGALISRDCAAMHEAFDLQIVDVITIHEGPYVRSQGRTNPDEPIDLALYRVGPRRLSPAAAQALLASAP